MQRLGPPFAATRGLARSAPAGLSVRRADGQCRGRASRSSAALAAACAGRAGAPRRRPCPGGARRRRRRAGRLRDRDARDGARQAADGRCLPRGAADRLAAAAISTWSRPGISRSRTCSPGRDLVPEFFQEEVTARGRSDRRCSSSSSGRTRAELNAAFTGDTPRRCVAMRAQRAADAILELVAADAARR